MFTKNAAMTKLYMAIVAVLGIKMWFRAWTLTILENVYSSLLTVFSLLFFVQSTTIYKDKDTDHGYNR